MVTRQQLVLLLAGTFFSLGASYRTTNFLVDAPNAQVAEQVGQWAEYYRKEKAMQWIGREMPLWPDPCPIKVKVTIGGAGGATSFNFMHGQVWQTMTIEGPLDRLLQSVLPHEVTHTVFGHYFRCPVPRWADEGGAVLSEDDLERGRHDQMVRQILNGGKAMPLRRLFSLRDYPRDVGALYAEGYSVADFLVTTSSRPAFLAFVAQGMQYDWDSAVQTHYRYQNVEQLEQAWKEHLINTKRQAPAILARNNLPVQADPAKRTVVRLTAPPAQPLPEVTMPVIRAQAPDLEPSATLANAPRQPTASRPGYLPEYPTSPSPSWAISPAGPPPGPVSQDGWLPPGARLGSPQFAPMTTSPPRTNIGPASPVGYPR